MKLENAELNVILMALNEYTEKTIGPQRPVASSAKRKLEEFMQTSGTTCPTATLICPFYSGSKTSDAKAAAARENGKKGGRPRKDAKVENEEVVGDAFVSQNFK